MGLFDNDAVYFVESGKRARKLAADTSDPAGAVVAVSNTDRGDGAWILDMTGDPDNASVGRACELNGQTREVKDGNLAQAFPYMVDGGRGRAVMLIEDVADVPRVLRWAGADMTTVLTQALEGLAYANQMLGNYRTADAARHAAKRNTAG